MTLFEQSRPSGAINWDIRWEIMYERGIPIALIGIIRMAHHNTRLRGKNNGKIDAGSGNKRVFQGGTQSAYIFIIYSVSMMEYYEGSLNKKHRITWRVSKFEMGGG